MVISVVIAIMFPYVDYNDPSRADPSPQTSSSFGSKGNGNTDSSQDVNVAVDGSIASSSSSSSSIATGSGSNSNHQSNIFDNESDNNNKDPASSSALLSQNNDVNDAASTTELTQSTPVVTASCNSLLLQSDADSNGMLDSIEYRNFIDELKVSDIASNEIMATFDFGAYSSSLDGLPLSLKLKFVSLSSSSSKYCLDGETTITTAICIGTNNFVSSSGSSNNIDGDLNYICEETLQIMEEIVMGRSW